MDIRLLAIVLQTIHNEGEFYAFFTQRKIGIAPKIFTLSSRPFLRNSIDFGSSNIIWFMRRANFHFAIFQPFYLTLVLAACASADLLGGTGIFLRREKLSFPP